MFCRPAMTSPRGRRQRPAPEAAPAPIEREGLLPQPESSNAFSSPPRAPTRRRNTSTSRKTQRASSPVVKKEGYEGDTGYEKPNREQSLVFYAPRGTRAFNSLTCGDKLTLTLHECAQCGVHVSKRNLTFPLLYILRDAHSTLAACVRLSLPRRHLQLLHTASQETLP